MPHIDLPPGLPGIVSLFAFRPETAGALQQLAETLLRGPSPLSSGDRETIAAYVSSLNACDFCCASHRAVAAAHLGSDVQVDAVLDAGPRDAPVSGRLRALLEVAAQVQRSGRDVSADAVAAARDHGATDVEIHDTVLVAAAFCMFNRYVDGLATTVPDDPSSYAAMGRELAQRGYLMAEPAVSAAG